MWLKWLLEQRFWVGMTMVLSGAGLILIHFIDYGGTIHFTFPDHGTAGIILVILGGLIGGLKPGERRQK